MYRANYVIQIIIMTDSYSERLKNLSRVLQDQKDLPGERAVWWLEYAIRNQGEPHMIYRGKNLHFLQYICLDVILFYSALIYLFHWLAKKTVERVYASFKKPVKRNSKKKRA